MRTHRQHRSAFTLIEILIVVVILGILAAIVIPQFTDASQEASNSSVRSMLQTVRSQVELYRVKHGGTPPADIGELVDPADADENPYLQADPNTNMADGYSITVADGVVTWTCPDDVDCTEW
jgi:prepilin-type N-terminal cleavage/methylation domain-containing protein